MADSRTLAGSLAAYDPIDETPHIGTTLTVQLSALLTAPNADALLTDLAALTAHRGVVFFRAQDLTLAQQKELATRLGVAGGKPASSGLHRHPVSEATPELGADVSVISSAGGIARAGPPPTRASTGWHADITFERVPADYSILKMHTLPPVGGDTLWASGYEAYDKLSPPFARFLEGLTAVHNADFFNEYARAHGIPIQDPRGSPENTGEDLTAVHPVIRTHPITGFKSVFVNRSFTTRIVELAREESADVLAFLFALVAEGHDLQVRFRWRADDVAVWDNRCALHAATHDYSAPRAGTRVVSIGEKPFFDRASRSRRAALGLGAASAGGYQ